MPEPRLILGDCIEAMRELADCSIDAVVTDPPYGISFMGKHWDRFDIDRRVGQRDVGKLGVRLTGNADPNVTRKETTRTASAFANAAGEAGGYDFSLKGNRVFQEWTEQWAREAFRVLKPGGHLLCFAATRTYHRMAAGVEDAGFEIRDQLAWIFGSGFPKSLDVSKAIDKSAGAEREVVGSKVGRPGYSLADGPDNSIYGGGIGGSGDPAREAEITAPATDDARAWEGWGTALKPAFEPIVLARKPLGGTVAATVLEHGTGALNIDGCRIEHVTVNGGNLAENPHLRESIKNTGSTFGADGDLQQHQGGRWPANVLLDEEAAAMLDEQTGELTSGANPTRRGSDKFRDTYGAFPGQEECEPARGADSGGASRFFYCAKVSRSERNAGLDGFEEGLAHDDVRLNSATDRSNTRSTQRNVHPTVKPLDLMRWLLRLVTPPGGVVLDPFLGSGSTGCAAALEGFGFVGCEREPDYMAIAEARIAFWAEHGDDGMRICAERDAATRRREEIVESGQLDLLAAPVEVLEGTAVAVGQTAVSGSAAINGEPERVAAPSSTDAEAAA